MKKLIEKKNQLIAEMRAIVENAETEERAMTDEEAATFAEKQREIEKINQTIQAKENLRSFGKENAEVGKENGGGTPSAEETEQAEERAFAAYIRNEVEQLRAGESQLTMEANGAVIPTTIMQRIIRTLSNISPIFERASKYNIAGNADFPVIDETEDDITVDYATEFSDLAEHTFKFSKVTLSGYLIGALCLVSRSLINNSTVDIVSIVVTQMAYKLKIFLDNQCLVGSEGKISGVLDSKNVKETASSTAITADELIELQALVLDVYQGNAFWIMHPKTRTLIRQLKDSQGRYIFNNDVTTGFKDTLLGKPVEISDQMPEIGSGNKCVVYGDYSGYGINIRENAQVQVLREKYATQHADGIVLWAEIDGKILEPQKFSVLKCKA